MQIRYILSLGLSAMLFTSCGDGSTEGTAGTDSSAVVSKPAIELADVSSSPDYPGAQLTIGDVKAEKQGNDSVKVSFSFNVKNYELKMQTADASGKLCNNSDKGQHIHFIMDNKPYIALYEPKHEVVLPLTSEHNVLVFLSRSYHESVKNKEASALLHFSIDGNGKLRKMETPQLPMLFYSRPKGDYLGKDTENLLLDFYLLNTTLSPNSYKVKAQIVGEGLDTTLTIADWKAQFLKGMPMGKSSITLTLVDSTGNKVASPQAEVNREFNLAKEEPMNK